jgi:hypothetical protein
MRTASWICTALATVALATPALAQTTPARATPLSGRDGAITEMQRPGPAVPQQNRAGATADAIGETHSGSTEFLKQAQAALRIGNLGVANELLERAATRMLSRSTVATEAGVSASPAIASGLRKNIGSGASAPVYSGSLASAGGTDW